MITTFRLFGGIMTGGGLLMTYRSLKSVEQGKTVFIAYKQSTILYDLALSTFSLLKDMELSHPAKGRKYLYARLIAYPLPFALQILHYNLDEKKFPKLKAGVEDGESPYGTCRARHRRDGLRPLHLLCGSLLWRGHAHRPLD